MGQYTPLHARASGPAERNPERPRPRMALRWADGPRASSERKGLQAMTARRILTGVLLGSALLMTGAKGAAATNLIALSSDRTLLTIDAKPAVVRRVNISGLKSALLGIDFRPADGRLYGLLANGEVVTINPRTGVATPRVVLALTTPLSPSQRFTVDFNPTVDRLRILSNGGTAAVNLAANVDDGTVVAGTAPAFPPPPAVNPFGGSVPAVVAGAYTNNVAGAKGTLLFDIDDATDAIYLQHPPATGTLTNVGEQLGITVGQIGFDIATDGHGRNRAYLISGGRLYSPDLLSGSVGRGAKVMSLSGPVRDLAVPIR